MACYSSAFKITSEIVSCQNLAASNGVYPVALDIGYSAVKGFSPCSRFCFPAYVKEVHGEMIGNARQTDFLYRGEDGIIYSVGTLALNGLSSRDTNDASNSLFGRNRYFAPSFLILTRVGLAIAMRKGLSGGLKNGDTLFLQTGLPPAYRKADTPLLVDALSGLHKFEIKIGGGAWQAFEFSLNSEHISVIDQPIGSVYSAIKASDGKTVTDENGRTYIDCRTLVLDGGFGTFDVFSIANRRIDSTNTFSDLGMKAIFELTAADIFENHGKEVYAHTLQPYLESGTISVLNRKSHSTDTYDITELLRRNTYLVCEKALRKVEVIYDDLSDYDYLVVTGGTGAAWLPYIQERYKNMSTLKIICANQNENINPIYNNVRGYYIYRALAGLRV